MTNSEGEEARDGEMIIILLSNNTSGIRSQCFLQKSTFSRILVALGLEFISTFSPTMNEHFRVFI